VLNLLPFPYRMLALALLAGALWFHGWIRGVHHEEAKFEAYKAQQMAQAATELGKRLAQQTELQRKNEGIANDLQKAKQARAADAVVTAGKLRDFNAAIDSAARNDASACPGTNATRTKEWDVLRSCADSLGGMAETADRLADKIAGLQDYAKLCLAK
jgi:hypothetical protein